jgi:hypothetical protein
VEGGGGGKVEGGAHVRNEGHVQSEPNRHRKLLKKKNGSYISLCPKVPI